MKDNFCLKYVFTKIAICFIVAFFIFANFFPAVSFVYRAEAKIDSATYSQPLKDSSSRAINYTIFIKNATYSAFYQDKVFFIDEDTASGVKNYTLKACDATTKVFEQTTLPLTDIGEIIDVAYVDGKFFILSTNGIYYVSITVTEGIEFDFSKLDTLEGKVEPENFGVISAYKYAQDDEYVLSLTPTPENLETNTLPELIVLSNELAVTKHIKLNLTEQTDLIKVAAISSTGGDASINFLLVYETTAAYINVKKESITSTPEDGTLGEGYGGETSNFNGFKLDSTERYTSVNLVNILEVEENTYLFVTYDIDDGENHTSKSTAYKLIITGDSFSTDIKKTLNINNEPTLYGLVSDNKFLYSTGQVIHVVEFGIDGSDINSTNNSFDIENPTIKFNYFETSDEFEYYQTTSETHLLNSPWSPVEAESQSILLAEKTDVILVGKAAISTTNTTIEDYLLCLYSDTNGNHIGFTETENLVKKQQLVDDGELDIDEYNLILKVKPNSALYSLPTKAEKIKTGSDGGDFENKFNPKKILNIKDNSRVECLDSIYNYTCANSIYLKVKVNDSQVGYIEKDSIIKPSEANDFVITNSYIKEDGTKVYLEDNLNSSIIYVLNADKRVKINGSRNTKTGFTYITFNDEYGNEFSGYIKTDFIKSDGWSSLQIAGCILIAINIGLLCLILYFRETRIGVGGQKYEKEKEK